MANSNRKQPVQPRASHGGFLVEGHIITARPSRHARITLKGYEDSGGSFSEDITGLASIGSTKVYESIRAFFRRFARDKGKNKPLT